MNTDRDAGGRFRRGNPGGPGRPKKQPIESRYLAIVEDIVTETEWRRLIYSTLERARGGDAKAREWLAKHLIGREKPKATGGVSAAESESLHDNGPAEPTGTDPRADGSA